jgi:hypothetical protein
MPLIRFHDPSSRDLTDIQTQVNQLFDNLLGQPSSAGLTDGVWAPPADMWIARCVEALGRWD